MNTYCSNFRGAVPALAVFATMLLFNWLYHGHLMMPMYEATASLWRSEAEMENLWGFCLARQALQAIVIAWIFSMNYENRGTGEGARFGLMIGLLLGLHAAGSFMFLPIPAMLAVWWFAGEVLLGLLIGVVLSFTYRSICKPAAV